MIGERFNFEDVFFRDLTVCVLDTLEGQIKWTNRFTSGDVFVQVPIYYSLTGDERFLLDSFSDDIVSENRFIELNTDLIPRGHLTMTGFNIKSDEFANPNVWLRMVVENEFEIRKVLGKVRAIPIVVNYDLEITLSSEIDTFKCSQAILDTLWIYKFMYFEHNFMNIDAVLTMPDSNTIEMSREKNLTSENNIKLKCSFTVETYYPAFRRDRVVADGYPREYGSGMKDGNGFALSGGISEYFEQPPQGMQLNTGTVNTTDSVGVPTGTTVRGGTGRPGMGPNGRPWIEGVFDPNNPLPKYGQTGSFHSTSTSTNPSDPFGTFGQEGYGVTPKRTRWFNNILRSRERAGGSSTDPVTGQQNVSPRNPNQ